MNYEKMTRKDIGISAGIVLVLIVLHYIFVRMGLYRDGIAVDMPQHVAGGAVFAYIALRWIRSHAHENLSKPIIFYIILSFAVFSSFLWELLEFVLTDLTPNFAGKYYLHSSTATDLLSDLLFGFFGGLIIALYAISKKDNFSTPHNTN